MKRQGEQVSAGYAVVRALDEFAIGADWTEAQWADHDARVAQKKRELEVSTLEGKRATPEGKEIGRWTALIDAGFPRRAVDAARAADTRRAAIVRLSQWDPSDRCVMLAAGAAGCGKTVAATWWASTREKAPLFVRASTFAASSRYDSDKREPWLKASGLVLDDLGAEYLDAKGSFLADLDELVDTFYGDKRPLVITTNCTREVLEKRYGERVYDRLRECGVFWSTDEESMRRNAP